MMFTATHVRVPAKGMSPERLDTGFYSKAYFDVLSALEDSGLEFTQVGKVSAPWCFGAYALCNEIVWSDAKNGVPYVKAEALGSPLVNFDGLAYVTPETHKLLTKSQLRTGDIIVSTSGTIGQCAVLPRAIEEANSNQDTIKFNPANAGFDNYFVVTWITSKYGQIFLQREAGGAIQQHIYLYNFQRLPLLKPHYLAQTYIGDKVRQAEQLRERARELETRIQALVQPLHIRNALKTPDSQYNRLEVKELQNRLDAKYYNHRSMEIFDACKDESTEINDLIISVSNGFEYRNFVSKGLPYITVSEVSSGRLDLNDVPRIPVLVEVPDKARINSNCILVVRTGSIGIAVKVHEEDEGASISSHLIRLEFQEESVAAAVAAFLNSAAGNCLLYKISYGAVQPQVGQEEVLSLPVPQIILNNSEEILHCTNLRETALRSAERLTTGAKLLVEALIEGNVTELDLQEAQKAIHQGNYTLDRQILSRLTLKGILRRSEKTNEPPLFPALDALYLILSNDNDADDDSDWDSAPKSQQQWRRPLQLLPRAAEASTSYQVDDSELALQFHSGGNTLLDEEVY